MQRTKRWMYHVINASSVRHNLSWYFDIALISLILLNVLAIVLESVPSLRAAYQPWFDGFEVVSVVFFSMEYLLRIWTITEDPRYQHPLWGRLRYLVSPMALIDFLAILPFYVGIYVQVTGTTVKAFDARFLRMLRIFRLFRLFKIVRYVAALQMIRNVFRAKKEELLISLGFIMFMLLLVSCGMYYIEKDSPDSQFVSIPATMWWGVATLTTVGYGDMYPVTPLGKFLGGLIAILGIGLFALPTGILAAGTAEEIEKSKKRLPDEARCPRCGQPLPSATDGL
jgi:voltage-gated potassium channel